MSDETRSVPETRGEHRAAMERWAAQAPLPITLTLGHYVDRDYPDLYEALYTLNELGLWPDGGTVSPDQAVAAWRLVELLRQGTRFPSELRM